MKAIRSFLILFVCLPSAFAESLSPLETEIVTKSALDRSRTVKFVTREEVVSRFLRAGDQISQLAKKNLYTLKDVWMSPPNAEEIAYDVALLRRRWPNMSVQEATARVLHAEKEMELLRGGGVSFLQIAGAGLLARAVVDGYRFQKPIETILKDSVSEDVIPSAIFAGSEWTTMKLFSRRLAESRIPTPLLRTAQVWVPLSAAFIVADGIWHRKGEIYQTFQRHAADGNSMLQNGALYVDLARAILHDQAYDLGGAFLMFGFALLPAVAIEESAAVATSIGAEGAIARLILMMRSYPIVSSLAVGAAYVGWMAGRPIYDRHIYREREQQAGNYLDLYRGVQPRKDTFWLKASRYLSRQIDWLALHTVSGKWVDPDERRSNLQKYFDLKDANHGYWIHRLSEVRKRFAEYLEEVRHRIQKSTVESNCYRVMQVALSSGKRNEIDRFIRREVAPKVLNSHSATFEGVSYSEIVAQAKNEGKSINDYLQDRYATSEVTFNELDSEEQRREKQCLLFAQQSVGSPQKMKWMESQIINLELTANLQWAHFLTDRTGIAGWTDQIRKVTQESIGRIDQLLTEEQKELGQYQKEDLVQNRLSYLKIFQDQVSKMKESLK